MTRSIFLHRRGPASGTLLSADSFNRANSTTGITLPDGTGLFDPCPWRTNGSETFGINANQAYAATIFGLHPITYQLLGQEDVDVQVTVATPSFGAGIAFRWQVLNSYWVWLGTATVTQLFKVIGGTFTQVGTDQAGAAAGDVLRVVARGSSINAYRNGTSLITTTDTALQGEVRHGLWVAGTAARLDDWSIRVA